MATVAKISTSLIMTSPLRLPLFTRAWEVYVPRWNSRYCKRRFSCQCMKAILSTYQFSLVRLQPIRVLLEALKELGCTSRLDSRQSIYVSHSLQSLQHFRRRSASTIAVSIVSNNVEQKSAKCSSQIDIPINQQTLIGTLNIVMVFGTAT